MYKKFFITTPIYYVNDIPHIGHACTTIAADILARAHRQQGEEVFFLTGTDEHGAKVAQAAKDKGLEPKEFCDQIAPKFEENWKRLLISHDFFIRTTNPGHEKVVSEFISKVYNKGDIYKKNYEGWYCLGCEEFKNESDLVDGHCPEHKKEQTVWQKEENYFFKLSKYIPQIIDLIENEKTNYVFPEGRRKEILAKLKAGVNDISISRANVSWGIPIPWDKTQSIYVWFDALPNYYSATQFVQGKAKFWPADLHLVGKGINWFHTVFWQGMLLSAGVELPRKVYAHSHFNVAGQKMSKSLGNVISPEELMAKFGVEATRYLIAKAFPGNDDADITWEQLTLTYNADLANNYGNLVSRLAKLAEGFEPVKKIENSPELKKFNQLLDNLAFNEAIEKVFMNLVDQINTELNMQAPWKFEKEDPKRKEVIWGLVEKLVLANSLIKPIMPNVADKVEEMFTTKTISASASPLFPRI